MSGKSKDNYMLIMHMLTEARRAPLLDDTET
jgi:hypothetical protein